MAIASSLLNLRRIIPGIAPQALVVDGRRARPLWFDGQFVTAEVFNQEQSYVLTRQADLGLALGKGVVEGLHVTRAADGDTALLVSPGQGIGGGGEAVVLHEPLRIDLADLSLQRSLAQALGIARTLAPPAESRSGLFVLAASPLEFTSNPVGAYPTSLDGERRLEDSVINEAVLFSLVPYALTGNLPDPEQRRALAARRIFADGGEPQLPGPALALALLELAGNTVVWLDPDLVRREAGAIKSDAFDLDLAPASRRTAHLRQYQAQLDELVQAHPGAAFPARGRFQVLPAMGRLPAPAVAFRTPPGGGAAVLSQVWFPPAMPVELAPIPEDELPALLEDSFLLPPIDLDADAATQANTPVTVFVPVPRAGFEQVVTDLGGESARLPPPAPLGTAPSAPRDLLLSLLGAEAQPAPPPAVDEAAWQALLAGRTFLWYARRRQLAARDSLVGQASPFLTPDQILQPGDGGQPGDGEQPGDPTPRVRANLERFGLERRFARLLEGAEATAAGRRRLAELLDRQGKQGGLVLDGVLAEAAALPRLDGNAVRGLESRYADAGVNAALSRYEGAALGVDSAVLLLGPGQDAEATVDFVRNVTGLGPVPATELVRKAPSVLPVDLADAPKRLQLVFKGEDNGVPLGLRPAKPASELTVQLRGLLARSLRVPELGGWLVKAGPPRRLEGLTKLSGQVQRGDEPERLAETIESLMKELP